MYIEHLIYSAALAVIVGMVWSRRTGRDPSWIIIAVAFVPDIDLLLQMMHESPSLDYRIIVQHGGFHNILMLVVFSLLIAAALSYLGFRFIDGLICSGIGIAAHLFEDALISPSAYAFLWPFTSKVYGIGIMREVPNVFGIANSTVLLVGFVLLAIALVVRTVVEGTGWEKVFLRGGRREDPDT